MAITNTWSVSDMQHTDADGGVFLVYWSMVAASDGTPSYTASEGGKLRCEYDASSPTYIPYADLTEADVLGWVYASLVEGEETPDEAKSLCTHCERNVLNTDFFNESEWTSQGLLDTS